MPATFLRNVTAQEFLEEMDRQDITGKHGTRQEKWRTVVDFESRNPENSEYITPFVLIGDLPIEWLEPEHEPNFPSRVHEYAMRKTPFPPINVKLGAFRLGNEGEAARPKIVNGNHRVTAAKQRGDTAINALMSRETWKNIQRRGFDQENQMQRRWNPQPCYNKCMCPPNAFHVLNGLDVGIRQLLINVAKRRDFGTGASPGGRPAYINAAMVEGLVVRLGYYPKTGHVKFNLTPCGKRVAKFLAEREEQTNKELIEADYNAGICPLKAAESEKDFDITKLGYHDYEHWNENPVNLPLSPTIPGAFCHGTTSADLIGIHLEGFQPSLSGFGQSAISGVGLLIDMATAWRYAESKAGTDNSSPVVLALGVPEGSWADLRGLTLPMDILSAHAEDAGVTVDDLPAWKQWYSKYSSIQHPYPLTAVLQELGYDGAIIDSTLEEDGADEYIWFDPTTVKIYDHLSRCSRHSKRKLRRRNPESHDRRLRKAEREYLEFPCWDTWEKYNHLRRQAGLDTIPIPREKGTINAPPGFHLRATLGDRIPLRSRNPYRRNMDESVQELRREAATGDRDAQLKLGRSLLRSGQTPQNLQEFADWLLAHPEGLQGGFLEDNETLSQIYQQYWFLKPLRAMIVHHLNKARETQTDPYLMISTEAIGNIEIEIDNDSLRYNIRLTTYFTGESEAHGEVEVEQIEHELHDLERELSELPYLDLGYPEGARSVDLNNDEWYREYMGWDDDEDADEDFDPDDPPGRTEVTLTAELGIHHLLGVFTEAKTNYQELLDLLPQDEPERRKTRRRNPSKKQRLRKWEKIKRRTEPRIKAWIAQRIEDQRPITYRFVNRLISNYAERYKIPSGWALEHLQECGIKNILIQGPTNLDQYPARDSYLRPTADWMWRRRDLRSGE
jgi:hypothetical protein